MICLFESGKEESFCCLSRPCFSSTWLVSAICWIWAQVIAPWLLETGSPALLVSLSSLCLCVEHLCPINLPVYVVVLHIAACCRQTEPGSGSLLLRSTFFFFSSSPNWWLDLHEGQSVYLVKKLSDLDALHSSERSFFFIKKNHLLYNVARHNIKENLNVAGGIHMVRLSSL